MSIETLLGYTNPKHKQILDMVRLRRRSSSKMMSKYYPKWNDAEDSFQAYQKADDIDNDRKSKKKSTGQHDYVTITVPYSFATIMTAHTYWSTVFLSRSPIYQLAARHGEAQGSVEAFEAVLDYQRVVGEHLIPLYNWIFDMAKYGLGIIGSYWDKRSTTISRIIDKPVTIMGVPILGQTKKALETVTIPKYFGNALYNIRPYDFFPDPRVSIVSFQKGEFCGRDTQEPWHKILEGRENGDYFNIDVLSKMAQDGSWTGWGDTDGSQRENLPERANEFPQGVGGADAIPGPGFVNIHEMGIRLIPSVVGLGPSNKTEIWVFTVANGSVVIGAKPQGLYHDEFAFDVLEFGMGAHSFLKMNLTEVMDPMIETISWLLNSHFYNVRKALNDQKVVDPSRIIMKDLTSPIERGIIRLSPLAYGTDTSSPVHQLTTPDMTQTHLRDMQVMEQMLQKVTGVVDDLMGLSGGPDRESATGVRTRTGGAISRLKTVAEYNSALGFSPMIGKLISNTQQLMDTPQKFRIAGAESMSNAQAFLDVNPELIAGFYDFVAVDGSLPIDRLAQANFWKELVIQGSQSLVLQNQWDWNKMIAYIMKLQGEKNINQFRLNVIPNQQVEQQTGAGNIVPIGGKGGSNSRAAGGSSGATV